MGLGNYMLSELVSRLSPEGLRFVEATVTPSNTASDRVFRKFAEHKETSCKRIQHFEKAHFGSGNHEAELLYRIGPILTVNKGNISI